MYRREILKKLALALPSAAFFQFLLSGCGDDDPPTVQTDKKVIVIGAGMSGLAAARKLKNAGVQNIIVLEGRNRIGGRIHTDRSSGLPFDAGASWIHGPDGGNPLTGIASASGAQTFSTNDDRVRVYDRDGTLYEDSDLDDSEAIFEALLEQIQDQGTIDKSVWQVLNELSPGALTNRLRAYEMSAYLEFDTGGDIMRLSSSYFFDDEAFPGTDRIITNGFDQLTDHLASGIDVRTGQKVISIQHGPGNTTVQTATESFEADFVIVTVPLGILQRRDITFSPDLPAAKWQSVDNLEMGVVNKVLLVWDENLDPFWDTSLHYIGYTGETKGKYNYFLNLRSFSTTNALMTFGLGNFAREMELHTDEQVVEDVMSHLRNIYGNQIPEPVEMRRTRWSMDPFAAGAYTFPPVGSQPADFDELARPVSDRLFFAGEHTIHAYRGTVHGAYLSGERAAQEILDRL